MAIDTEIYASGQLVLLRKPNDTASRHLAGPLYDAPQLYVHFVNAEMDREVFERISFLAAKALAPRDVDHIYAQVKEVRCAEEDKRELRGRRPTEVKS